MNKVKMTIEGFDYKNFAGVLASQAAGLLPDYFDDFQKGYVINTITNFSTLAGEALYNDTATTFNADQAMIITQIIAEWSFHKSVDLVKSGVLSDYWDGVMQKIAFTIFEVAKQAMAQEVPTEEILELVERHVKQSYEEALAELKTNGIIDETLYENASHQSNIDVMMEQIQEDKAKAENVSPVQSSDAKLLKLASLALLLKQVSQAKAQVILSKFNSEDAQLIIHYMQMPNLDQTIDKNIAMNCLRDMKTNLPEPKKVNPNKIISKINNIANEKGKVNIAIAIKKERANVQFFINNAMDGEFVKMPTKVANIIAQHLEERI